MNYEFFADIVMIFHTILIFAVLVGILVSVRYRRFRPVEAFVLLFAIIIWSIYQGCPLTYLESTLRIYSGHPLPISETGFIPFYFSKWFGFVITDHQLTIGTYVTAIMFFATSIKWLSPFVNFEIIKIRKSLGHLKSFTNPKY